MSSERGGGWGVADCPGPMAESQSLSLALGPAPYTLCSCPHGDSKQEKLNLVPGQDPRMFLVLLGAGLL